MYSIFILLQGLTSKCLNKLVADHGKDLRMVFICSTFSEAADIIDILEATKSLKNKNISQGAAYQGKQLTTPLVMYNLKCDTLLSESDLLCNFVDREVLADPVNILEVGQPQSLITTAMAAKKRAGHIFKYRPSLED